MKKLFSFIASILAAGLLVAASAFGLLIVLPAVSHADPGIAEYPVPTSSAGPGPVTAGSDGNLWFAEEQANKIAKISTSGTVTEYPIPTSNAVIIGITAGPDGNLWFTEARANKIGSITAATCYTHRCSEQNYREGTTHHPASALPCG